MEMNWQSNRCRKIIWAMVYRNNNPKSVAPTSERWGISTWRPHDHNWALCKRGCEVPPSLRAPCKCLHTRQRVLTRTVKTNNRRVRPEVRKTFLCTGKSSSLLQHSCNGKVSRLVHCMPVWSKRKLLVYWRFGLGVGSSFVKGAWWLNSQTLPAL